MPSIRFEVNGQPHEQFVIRDGTKGSNQETRPSRRRPKRDRLSQRQRQMLAYANEDVFFLIQRIEEHNQNRKDGVAPEPCRLFWTGDDDQFYKTSAVLRSVLSTRCRVDVINRHGGYGWQITFH